MAKVDRGGRWHATIPKKGNRWIDMPDRALEKLADLLEDDADTRETARFVGELLDSNRTVDAQDSVQAFIEAFPFDEIIAKEQDRSWTDENGEPTDQGPVEKAAEALQAFVDASPEDFEAEVAKGPDPAEEPGSTAKMPEDVPDEDEPEEAPASAPADDFSAKIQSARKAIEELKNSGLTPEQVKAVDNALKEIDDLVSQVAKSNGGSAPAVKPKEKPKDEAEEPKPDAEPEAEAKPETADELREAIKARKEAREAQPETEPAPDPDEPEAKDKAEESHETPEETPDEPAESDPADADAQSEIAGVAALKKAFEDGYSTSDESIWQGKRGSVEIGTLGDGTKVVRKVAPNEEEADKEALIGLVANVLGIDVATAKISATELVTHHIQGGTGNEWLRQQMNDGNPEAGPGGGKAEKLGRWKQDGVFEKKMVREMKGAKEIGLLDYLTNNPDRHAGNWMVRGDDEVVPIDHGNAKFELDKFQREGKDLIWFNGSPFMKYWLGMQTGKYKEIKSMDPGQHWDKAELQAYRSKLAGLKDEFSSRPEWHAAIMANIDNVLEQIK